MTHSALERIATAAERLAAPGPELEPFRLPGREYDHLGRAVPRNPFAGKQGVVLFLQWPGAAEQFAREVPTDYRLGPWVLCMCGELVALEVGEIAECAGECGRFFLRTEASVRVARWPKGGAE